jgi:hypothetical protein
MTEGILKYEANQLARYNRKLEEYETWEAFVWEVGENLGLAKMELSNDLHSKIVRIDRAKEYVHEALRMLEQASNNIRGQL